MGPVPEPLAGEQFLLVARDEFSCYAAVSPLLALDSASVWRAFVAGYRPRVGEVRSLATDNGAEFHGEFSRAADMEGIARRFSIPVRPQTNSRCERFMRTVQNGIKVFSDTGGLASQVLGERGVFLDSQLQSRCWRYLPDSR